MNSFACVGHFAHVKLTQPIFHPNHMRLVQRVLQNICLACGVPKEKKKVLYAPDVMLYDGPPLLISRTLRGISRVPLFYSLFESPVLRV